MCEFICFLLSFLTLEEQIKCNKFAAHKKTRHFNLVKNIIHMRHAPTSTALGKHKTFMFSCCVCFVFFCSLCCLYYVKDGGVAITCKFNDILSAQNMKPLHKQIRCQTQGIFFC